MERNRAFLAWMAASVLAMIVGSLGTWARIDALALSFRGTEPGT